MAAGNQRHLPWCLRLYVCVCVISWQYEHVRVRMHMRFLRMICV